MCKEFSRDNCPHWASNDIPASHRKGVVLLNTLLVDNWRRCSDPTKPLTFFMPSNPVDYYKYLTEDGILETKSVVLTETINADGSYSQHERDYCLVLIHNKELN